MSIIYWVKENIVTSRVLGKMISFVSPQNYVGSIVAIDVDKSRRFMPPPRSPLVSGTSTKIQARKICGIQQKTLLEINQSWSISMECSSPLEMFKFRDLFQPLLTSIFFSFFSA